MECSNGHITNIYLSQNLLKGPIPSAIGAFTEIEYLGLYLNSLTGTIPSEIAGLKKLATLQLYGNYLKGTIPFSTGQLKQLTVLSLALNELTGVVPALNFKQLTGECYIDAVEDSDRTNHFKCPLPATASDCQFSGSLGVHCAGNSSNSSSSW